jgi:DNA-binding NtrC family response regulator
MSDRSGTGEVKGARILVVEDDAVLAFGMANGLREAGFEVVGPVATVTAAMRLLDQSECNATVLDVRLGQSESSEPVALELKARNIPFVAVTGYAVEQCPPAFDGAPVLVKPVRSADLMGVLRRCLAGI